MKIKSQISFLLILCLLFACQSSQVILHRSKPQRFLQSQADYTTENNNTLTVTDKRIEAPHLEEVKDQPAATDSIQLQTLALTLAPETKPLATRPFEPKPQSIKQQLTRTLVPHIKSQMPHQDAVGSTGFFGSVGHAFAVVGLVSIVIGLIFYVMGGIIGIPLGAFFIGIGFIFLLIWLVLFIIQSVFDVIL